jgi:hypothetical protein
MPSEAARAWGLYGGIVGPVAKRRPRPNRICGCLVGSGVTNPACPRPTWSYVSRETGERIRLADHAHEDETSRSGSIQEMIATLIATFGPRRCRPVFGTSTNVDCCGGGFAAYRPLRESLRRAVHTCFVSRGILEGHPIHGNVSIIVPFGLIWHFSIIRLRSPGDE